MTEHTKIWHWYSSIFLILVLVVNIYRILSNVSENTRISDPPLIRNVKWNDINFVHTTDTHGWYSGHINQRQYDANWGHFVSFTKHLKDLAHSKKQDILFVDTGDRHDGNGLSDITTPNGALSLPIFIKQEYDLLTVGNHELYEWENSKQEYDIVVQHFQANYISSNVEIKLDNGTYVPVGQLYKYFVTPIKKAKVLSFAFLFDFTRNNPFTKVTPIREVLNQDWFKKTLLEFPPEKVDLLVIFGHIPVSHNDEELFQLHQFLRMYYPTTKIQYFGGHSHIRDFSVYDENLTGLQSGRFCETAGWLSINLTAEDGLQSSDQIKRTFSRSYIDFSLKSFMHHSNISTIEEFNTNQGLMVSKQINDTRKELNLDQIIGHVKKNNYFMDYVPLESPKSIYTLITKRILLALESTNKNISLSEERLIIINTGSIRYDLYKGPYTVDTQYIISPFENDWVKLTLPKSIAVKIAPILNRREYIADANDVNNMKLLPEHQYSQIIKGNYMHLNNPIIEDLDQTILRYPIPERFTSHLASNANKGKSKGYVTHDDFGHDGDDTLHRAVVNYPITNVVQAEQLSESSNDADVDVIFYNFITPNVLWGLKEIGYEQDVSDNIEFYSDKYLGLLLNEYIKDHDI